MTESGDSGLFRSCRMRSSPRARRALAASDALIFACDVVFFSRVGAATARAAGICRFSTVKFQIINFACQTCRYIGRAFRRSSLLACVATMHTRIKHARGIVHPRVDTCKTPSEGMRLISQPAREPRRRVIIPCVGPPFIRHRAHLLRPQHLPWRPRPLARHVRGARDG